jgi:hypothetical protein
MENLTLLHGRRDWHGLTILVCPDMPVDLIVLQKDSATSQRCGWCGDSVAWSENTAGTSYGYRQTSTGTSTSPENTVDN